MKKNTLGLFIFLSLGGSGCTPDPKPTKGDAEITKDLNIQREIRPTPAVNTPGPLTCGPGEPIKPPKPTTK